MKNEEIKTEIGVTASVISLNCFNEIHMSVSPQEGVIGAHYKISEIAQEFVEKHKHIKDWDAYSDSIGCCDFEEVVLKFVSEKLTVNK